LQKGIIDPGLAAGDECTDLCYIHEQHVVSSQNGERDRRWDSTSHTQLLIRYRSTVQENTQNVTPIPELRPVTGVCDFFF
jgi:hypothetical protein